MRNIFIEELERSCGPGKNIFLMTGDLGFKLFDRFRKKFPGRFLNVGIAEPNMIGIAAGLGLSGKKVYCYSMIPFLITRCLEHIKIDICYNKANVRLVGAGCGFTYGVEGVTHHAMEDLAIMRPIPNMTIVAPGDPAEVSACVKASVKYEGPMFIRLGKNCPPAVYSSTKIDFKIGKGTTVLKNGNDVCILAAGSMLYNAKLASEALCKKGFGVTLISMHTIKPLDKMLIEECAGKFDYMVSVEEHSIIGGLGSAIAEVLSEISYKGAFKRIGIPDEFNHYVGKMDYLHEKYGLTAEKISEKIINFIEGK